MRIRQGDRYVDDAAFRRATLESSLVSKDNVYARLRLAKYDAERWGALPELNPETTPLRIETAPAADATWASIDTSTEDLRTGRRRTAA
ncbi:MAG: hypothetical protein U0270_19150 [Labilithrix sp.]